MKLQKRTLLKTAAAASIAAALSVPSVASAADTIKVGGLATLEGAFAALGEDGMRGLKMALKEFNYEINGKKIELITASSDASPDSAIRATRKLVEQDGIDILVGPLSGSEGIAVKDYSKSKPEVTFINGSSGAQDTTLRDPSPNFFRYNMEGAQWMSGLAEYVFKEKSYKRIAVLAEDYSFPYTQVMGFMLPFCELGGKVTEKFWVPIGNKDYSSVIAGLPDDIDAIYVALGGADSVNFLTQYEQAGGEAPLIGGTITVDQSVLGSKGRTRDFVIGTPAGSPIADTWDDPRWQAFVKAYQAEYPDGFPSPSIFAHAYYVNAKAAMLGLQAVKGDLSDGHKAYRAALASLEFETPTGMVKLDKNRQAIGDNFITEVVEGPDGKLVNKVVKIVKNVNQTLGMDEKEFLALGPVSRDNPECK
ncbi:MAG: ABC transporter substrate-binding protein [Burkholderiaceae bacterium]